MSSIQISATKRFSVMSIGEASTQPAQKEMGKFHRTPDKTTRQTIRVYTTRTDRVTGTDIDVTILLLIISIISSY